MNTHELAQRLIDAGCNPALYAIGQPGTASDAYCLTRVGAQWRVYYTERGHDSPPIYTSDDESQACDFFLQHMLTMRHDHCVGFFRARPQAEALLRQLEALGLTPWLDHIPYGSPSDRRYRVFVSGAAVFAARSALGSLPARDVD